MRVCHRCHTLEGRCAESHPYRSAGRCGACMNERAVHDCTRGAAPKRVKAARVIPWHARTKAAR